MDKRNVGKLAQKAFSIWCSQAGITCNKSDEDDESWDYVIEFDKHSQGVTYDKKQPRFKAFVQVKGSDDSRSNLGITLRNWEKMVNDDNPFFIVRIEYDKEIKPQRAFLVHVEKELIGKALKRLRKIDDPKSALLKRNMNYPRRDKDLIELNGSSLRTTISETLKDGMFRYSKWKSDLVKSIGHEKVEMNFTFKVDKNKYQKADDFIIDLALGKLSNVEILKGIKRETRFGIVSEEKIGAGFLKVEPKPSGKCELILKNLKTLKRCTLQLDYHFPAVDKSLITESNFKFLLKDELLEIEMKYSSLDFNYQVPLGKSDLNSYSFRNIFKFMDMFDDVRNNGGQIELTLNFIENKKTFQFKLGQDFKIENNLFDEIYLIRKSLSVLEDLGIDSRFDETIDFIYANSDKINVIADLLTEKEVYLKIGYKPNVNEELLGKKYVLSLVIVGDLGSFMYAYSIYLRGSFEKRIVEEEEGFRIELETNDAGIITSESVQIDDKKVINKKMDRIRKASLQYLENNYDEELIDLGYLQ